AHAAGDFDRYAAEEERSDERGADALLDVDCARLVVGETHDGECVATKARDRVGRAQRLAKTAADLDQQLIAEVMAERVVDLLEAIEIHHDHAAERGVSLRADD